MERLDADREIGKLLLRACHDLRAAIRAVRTHSELFLKDGAASRDTGFEERLGFIVEGARRADAIVSGLAAYAVALGTDPATFQPTRMDVLLRGVLAKLAGDLRECGAEVTYGELPAVTGNADRLMDVLENLLRNGLVHRGQAPPRIQVYACRQSKDWLFGVRDNGPGVEADFLESIFLPFERLHGNAGAGLGLAICRAIVERHGGRIWAESRAEAGTTFFFTLPAEQA